MIGVTLYALINGARVEQLEESGQSLDGSSWVQQGQVYPVLLVSYPRVMCQENSLLGA